MNQILSTESSSSKSSKGKPKDIRTIIKFFAIILIVFGIFLIASSSFSMYKNSNPTANQVVSKEKPDIQLENKGKTQIILKVMHTQEISEVTYCWNDEEEETLTGKGRKYIEQLLDIPEGTNTLKVKAVDVNNNIAEYTGKYTLESDISIDISKSGNKAKVQVTSVEEIDKIKYSWDGENEEELDGNDTEYSFEVDVEIGEHELIVTVVDVKGNEQKQSKKITGTSRPTVSISKGEDCYIIKVHDDIALSKLEIITLEDGKVMSTGIDGKDFEYEYPLKEGNDNLIKITAYNSNNVESKSQKVMWKK